MPVMTEGFKEISGILKDLASGIKTAVEFTENERKEMREAIANTAELIDETLTILKQHLTTVLSELKFGDKQKARQLIYELADFNGWAAKYRQFMLCDALREATGMLEKKGLYKVLNRVTYSDPAAMHQKMSLFLGGEDNAARTIATMIQELSQLADTVDTDYQTVLSELETARTEVGNWRQSFIDLELEIRNSI